VIYQVIKTYDVAEVYKVEASSEEEAIRYIEDEEVSDSANVYTVSAQAYAENLKVEMAR